MKQKIISKQTYKFELIHYADGTSTMNRENNGFSVFEMLGICEIIRANMLTILSEAQKLPDKINVKSKNSPFIHDPKTPRI